MKFDFDISESVIKAIAQEVVNSLKPLLATTKAEGHDPIFTPDQLAEYLHVTKQWIYERVSLGEIPYFKAGKYLRFRKSAIDKWVEAHSAPAVSPLSRRFRGLG